jgi:hypothetical protein
MIGHNPCISICRGYKQETRQRQPMLLGNSNSWTGMRLEEFQWLDFQLRGWQKNTLKFIGGFEMTVPRKQCFNPAHEVNLAFGQRALAQSPFVWLHKCKREWLERIMIIGEMISPRTALADVLTYLNNPMKPTNQSVVHHVPSARIHPNALCPPHNLLS